MVVTFGAGTGNPPGAPFNGIRVVRSFVILFFLYNFFCNFHLLQTLQTIMNNYTTRQNIPANYKITLLSVHI
jgi:hypothetical protein